MITAVPVAVVELGGPDVSPVGTATATHGGTDVDDFEDGDITVETSGWTGWTGDTGSFAAHSSDPIKGSNSGKLSASSNTVIVNTSADSSQTDTRVGARLRVSKDTDAAGDSVNFRVLSSGSRIAQVSFSDDDDRIEVFDGTNTVYTGENWVPGLAYSFELRNIDFSANTYELYINNENVGTYDFVNNANSFDEIEVRNKAGATSRDVFVDDVETGGSNYPSDKFSGGVLDDFEDNDKDVETTGWEGYFEDTGALSTSSDALHGDHSGVLTSNSDTKSVSVMSESGDHAADRIAFALNISKDTGNNGDGVQVYIQENESNRFFIHFEDSSEDIHVNGDPSAGTGTDTGWDWRPKITYHIEFRDINWSADTFDVHINGKRVLDDQSFSSSADGFDELKILTDSSNAAASRDVKLDNIEINNTAFSQPSYTTAQTEDFEDGDLSVETDGWGPEWYGDTGSLSTQSTISLEGTTSANLSASNELVSAKAYAISEVSVGEISARIRIGSDVGNTEDETILYVQGEGSGTGIFWINFEDGSNNISVNGDLSEGTGTDTGETWQPGTEYHIEFKNIDWSADTFDLWINGSKILDGQSFDSSATGFYKIRLDTRTASSAGSRDVTLDDINAGSCASDCDFTPAGSATSSTTVSGTVVNQNGDPIADATVQVWGVDYDQITPDAGETDRERALQLIEDAENKTPTEWLDQKDLNFQLQMRPGVPDRGSGHFETAESLYAAVHKIEDWKHSEFASGAKDNPTLNPKEGEGPLLSVSASRGETVTVALSVWNPQEGGLRNSFSPVKNDLPGEPVESSIVVETLVAADDSVGDMETTKTQIECNFVGCDWDSAFVEIELTPGFYRVYPEGHEETAYVIKVGNPIELIVEDLEDEFGNVLDQPSNVRDNLDSGKFTKTTTTTDSDGSFSVTVGSSVKTVAIQAYKAPDVAVNDSSLTYEETIDEFDNAFDPETCNELTRLGSIYSPSEVKRVDPPATDIDVEVVETTYPSYASDLESLACQSEERLKEMLNETLIEALGPFLDRIENVDRTDLENVHQTLRELYERNRELRDRIDELEDEITEESDDLTRSELEDVIDELYQAVEELGDQLEAEVEEDVGNDTITQRWTFASDIDDEETTVFIHWSNGSTTTLTTESEHLYVNKRAGLGDQVVLDEYPINDSDPSSLTFELLAVGEDEGKIGRERNTIRNPQFDGDVPSLDSIEVTSIEPGPNDKVDIELHPEDPADFDSIVSATVHDPDGDELTTDNVSSDGLSTGFRTDGAGVHHISITFNNSDGDEFTETFRLTADSHSDNRPPSAQIRSGPTGKYLLVGDGLESGTFDVSSDGEITVALQISEDVDTPGTVQVYLRSLETGSKLDATIRLVRGSSERSVSSQIGVILHVGPISEKATLYREDTEALPRGGSNDVGEVDSRGNGTTIQSFTESDGAVSITVENDPGLLDRALYQIRLASIPFISTSIAPARIAADLASALTAVIPPVWGRTGVTA
jgi:hypothetical protein